jgi:hypothetical protein
VAVRWLTEHETTATVDRGLKSSGSITRRWNSRPAIGPRSSGGKPTEMSNWSRDRGAAGLRRAAGRVHAVPAMELAARARRAAGSTRTGRVFRHDRFDEILRRSAPVAWAKGTCARHPARAQRRPEGANRIWQIRLIAASATRRYGVSAEPPQHRDDYDRQHEGTRFIAAEYADGIARERLKQGLIPHPSWPTSRSRSPRASGTHEAGGAPRHQARERHAARRRLGEGPRLRHRHEWPDLPAHADPPNPKAS